MKIFKYGNLSQGFVFPEYGKKLLTVSSLINYFNKAKANSLDGIRTPNNPKAHRRQLTINAGFFMRKIYAHSNYGGLDEAAFTLAVFFGAVVRTLFSSPPVMRFEPLGGDTLKSSKEAVIMTTIPTQAVNSAMLYTFLVARGNKSISKITRPRFISVCATSERQARINLSGLPLVFMKRIPLTAQGVAA